MVNPPILWRSLALCACLGLLAACSRGEALQPTTSAPGGDIARDFSLLADIPVPPGAALDTERSLVLGDLDRWTGRVILLVELPAAKMFGLYQTEMPNFGWQPVMSVQSDVSVLTYTRDDRAATVQIESRTLRGSVVSITVAPRHRVPSAATGAR